MYNQKSNVFISHNNLMNVDTTDDYGKFLNRLKVGLNNS